MRPETLSLASWSHRVDSTGRATTRVTPPGTEPIDDSRVAAVLNRIRYLPVPRFHRAPLKDRDYAGVEVQALVASWLAGFGDRVRARRHESTHGSPPCFPFSTGQHLRRTAGCQWPCAPSAAGCDRPRRSDKRPQSQRLADAATVLVAGDRAGGPLSDTFGPRCLRVARLLGFPLLEFGFIKEHGTTVLARVDPLPSLLEPWATAMTVDLLESRAGYRSG